MEERRTGLGLMEQTGMKTWCSELVAFHLWRQQKIISLLRKVNQETLSKQLSGSWSSLYVILNHLVWAEKTWLGRVSPNDLANMRDLDAEGLFREWEATSQRWKEVIGAASEADFSNTYTYYNTQGEKFTNSLAEIFIHLIDHSTYHIGQMMSAVRALGLEPVPTNFIHYLRAKN